MQFNIPILGLFDSFGYLPPTENGTYFCNECDSKFAEEEVLKRHMLQVHSDKPYKCDRCQAAFRYKGNLASHKTVHTGKKKQGEKRKDGKRLISMDFLLQFIDTSL